MRAAASSCFYSGKCAAPNIDAGRYAATGGSVYSFSLSAFAFGRMRVNEEWSLLDVAPANTEALAANRDPHISVQRGASAAVSLRCEPSFTPSRAPCAFSAAHNSRAVSSEASSHARLNKPFFLRGVNKRRD